MKEQKLENSSWSKSSSRAWFILSPPQLQASVALSSSESQKGDSTSFWLYLYSYCWLPLFLLPSFIAKPSGSPGSCNLEHLFLLIQGFCYFFVPFHSCSFDSYSLAATWFQLPCSSSLARFYHFPDLVCSSLLLLHGSQFQFPFMISVPCGFCYIVAPIASWLLCPFGPLLSCCFMASIASWPHGFTVHTFHGFCTFLLAFVA